MMSAQESNEIISQCLKMGALNYLIKPLKLQECRSLVGFIKSKQQNEAKAPIDQEKGLGRFEQLHILGKGAAGTVYVVKNKIT